MENSKAAFRFDAEYPYPGHSDGVSEMTAQVPIYVINMARSTDRWLSVLRQMQTSGLTPTRIDAVCGQSLSDRDADAFADSDVYFRNHGRKLIRSEIGCYMSHLKAVGRFHESRAQHGIIIEDDAVFLPSFTDVVNALSNRDLFGFDMIRLQGRRNGIAFNIASTGDAHVVVNFTRVTGATAYMINQKAARAYLKHLRPMTVPYDHAFDRPLHLGIRIGAVKPYPVIISNAPSTIETTRSPDARAKAKGVQKLRALAWRAETEICRVIGATRDLLTSERMPINIKNVDAK